MAQYLTAVFEHRQRSGNWWSGLCSLHPQKIFLLKSAQFSERIDCLADGQTGEEQRQSSEKREEDPNPLGPASELTTGSEHRMCNGTAVDMTIHFRPPTIRPIKTPRGDPYECPHPKLRRCGVLPPETQSATCTMMHVPMVRRDSCERSERRREWERRGDGGPREKLLLSCLV